MIRATVRMAMRLCFQVAAIAERKSRAESLTIAAVMSAETRIAVPVASGWKPHFAA
jgi:hypothetical protein